MRIYLAGVESKCTDILEEYLIKNGFASYYYLRNKSYKKGLERMTFLRKHINSIIIDSGAHSFFSELQDEGLSVSVHTKKTKTKETPDEYWEKYKKWLVTYEKYFDYFVELDIGEIVSQEKVLKWREEIKKMGLYHKCITVYHPGVVSKKEYTAMMDESESKYIALEGDRPKRARLPYGSLLEEAHKKGIRVHGFAMTKKNVMEVYPFYSVDSTSWIAGEQYGAGYISCHNDIKPVKFNDRNQLFSKRITEHIDVGIVLGDNKKKARYYMRYLGIMAFRKYEKYITRLWEKRGIKFK